MKNGIFLLMFLLLTSCFSCQEKEVFKQDLSKKITTTEQKAKQIAAARTKNKVDIQKTDWQDHYQLKKNVGYFYDSNTKSVIFIQYKQAPKILMKGPVEIHLSPNNELLLKESATARQQVIRLDNSIYGIGRITGNERINAIIDSYDSDGGGLVYEPDVIGLACGCFGGAEATALPNNCDSGGTGSSSCSITDSGGVASFNWNNTCSTTCQAGYTACCVSEGDFDDDEK